MEQSKVGNQRKKVASWESVAAWRLAPWVYTFASIPASSNPLWASLPTPPHPCPTAPVNFFPALSSSQCLASPGCILFRLVWHMVLSCQNLISKRLFPLTLPSPSQGSDTCQSFPLVCSPKLSLCRPLHAQYVCVCVWRPTSSYLPCSSSAQHSFHVTYLSTLTSQGCHPDKNFLAYSEAIWNFPGGPNGVIICIDRTLSPLGGYAYTEIWAIR